MQKPPFPGASECKYGVRSTDRALTITVFTDIGAVGTVIFVHKKERIFIIRSIKKVEENYHSFALYVRKEGRIIKYYKMIDFK